MRRRARGSSRGARSGVTDGGGRLSRGVPDLRHVRLVVIEDDVETLAFVATIFRLCGAKVDTFAEAGEALTVARQAPPPDAIITDIVLPENDGFWLADRLEAAGLARVPVIALTAYRRVDFDRVGRDRFAAWIRKPFDPIALCGFVRDVVPPPGNYPAAAAQA
jgi:CheY-like chemotaxis protein